MSPMLTDLQKADAAHVAALAASADVLRLDLSDDRQFRHAVDMHVLAGQTPDTHPGLHLALEVARKRHLAEGGPGPRDAADPDGFGTGAAIVAVTTLEGTSIAGSEGFASILGGAAMLTAALTVFDENINTLATGSDDQHGDGSYLGVATRRDNALPATANMTAKLQYAYQKQVGDPLIVEQVMLAAMPSVMADPVIQAPVKTETGSNPRDPRIRIGLARGDGVTTDVDYWFWQGTDNLSYAVPMVGYVDFNSPVRTPLSNIVISGYLSRGPGDSKGGKIGGMQPIPAAQKTNILNNCQSSGPRLRWSLPGGSVTDPNDHGNPIVWGPLPFTSDESIFLFLTFQVPLVGTTPWGVAVIQSSKDPDADPLDGVATIPPLDFIYHCIAADARIALSDGSEKRLDALTQDDKVRSAGDGTALAILSTRAGNHRGKAIRLSAGADREVVVTHNHLVLTPNGARRADSLAAGDVIVVSGGTAPLAAVAVVDYDGVLFNLSFSYPGVPVDAAHNAMFANGIAVCDYAAQVQAQTELREDPERILAALDPMFHEDYRNHLKRATRR